MTDDERAELVQMRAKKAEQAKELRTTIARLEARWQDARGPEPASIERRMLKEIESEIKAIDQRLG